MKLLVDDLRPAPDDEWLVARTVEDAQHYLERDDIEEVSLDHDMGACAACVATGAHIGDMLTPETTFMHWCPHVASGYDLACWMVEHQRLPPVIRVHTLNPHGRQRMMAILEGGGAMPTFRRVAAFV